MDQQKQKSMPSGRIMRLPEVESKTGLACSSIYSMMANNEFPLSIKLSKRSVGWLENEVEAWIEERINESRGGS